MSQFSCHFILNNIWFGSSGHITSGNVSHERGPGESETGHKGQEAEAGVGQHQEEGREAPQKSETHGQKSWDDAQVQGTLGTSKTNQVCFVVQVGS